MKPVQDFVATGTITYFWAGEEVTGPATVRGRAPDQFRLDANLPEGTRSYVVSHGRGALQETDGKLTEIPYHNTVNLDVLTFPYLSVATKLSDPATTASTVGVVDLNGRKAYQIRVQRNFPKEADPDGVLAKLTITDYFVDPATNLLVKTVDSTHPVESLTESYPHEIDFENYAPVSGVSVPTLVREKVGGQTVWELRLSSISFNTGLSDLDFTLQ